MAVEETDCMQASFGVSKDNEEEASRSFDRLRPGFDFFGGSATFS